MYILTFIIIFFYLFWAALNFLAWFRPKVLLKVMAFAKPDSSKQNQFQKELWDWFESPGYIWYMRFVLLVGLIGFTYFLLGAFGLID